MSLFLSEDPIWKGCPSGGATCRIVLVDCMMDSYIVTNGQFITYKSDNVDAVITYTLQGISNYYSACPISHV